jgi:hypothetical protein
MPLGIFGNFHFFIIYNIIIIKYIIYYMCWVGQLTRSDLDGLGWADLGPTYLFSLFNMGQTRPSHLGWARTSSAQNKG